MRLSDFFKRKESNEPFPEKGVFRNVRYRIDGDSVILTLPSGREMQIAPDVGIRSDEFDKIKADVVSRKRHRFWGSLATLRPSVFEFDTRGANQRTSHHSPQVLWDISGSQYLQYVEIADEILVKYIRSRAKQQ